MYAKSLWLEERHRRVPYRELCDYGGNGSGNESLCVNSIIFKGTLQSSTCINRWPLERREGEREKLSRLAVSKSWGNRDT